MRALRVDGCGSFGAPGLAEILLVGGRDTQFAGAAQDSALELGRGIALDLSRDPASSVVQLLPEHRNADAVGAQLAPENECGDLESLVGAFRRRVPVGDNHAAKRICRRQWQKRKRIQRSAPQKSVDANAGAAGILIVFGTYQDDIAEQLALAVSNPIRFAFAIETLCLIALARASAGGLQKKR